MLCTIDNILNYLNIKNLSPSDIDLLNDLIVRVSAEINLFCHRTFEVSSYGQYIDGNGTNHLFVGAYPIISIDSIYISDYMVEDATTLIDSDDYMVFDRDIQKKYGVWSKGENNILVNYSAGYVEIPHPIVQVCIEETGRKYKHRLDFDVISKSSKDGNTTFVEKGFLKKNLLVMKAYKTRSIS